MQLIRNRSARQPNHFFLIVLSLFLLAQPDSVRAQARSASRNNRDTLPEVVAKHALAAYNRHDATALQSFYDTVAIHEILSDSTKRATGTPQQMWTGIEEYWTKNKVRAELKQTMVSGAFVALLYDFIENGKRSPHLDIYEVRHGKIVHEWDQ